MEINNEITVSFNDIIDVAMNVIRLLSDPKEKDSTAEDIEENDNTTDAFEIIYDENITHDEMMEVYNAIKESNKAKGIVHVNDCAYAYGKVDDYTMFVVVGKSYKPFAFLDPSDEGFDQWLDATYACYRSGKENNKTEEEKKKPDYANIKICGESFTVNFGEKTINNEVKYYYKFSEKTKTPEFIDRFKMTRETESSMGGTLEDDSEDLRYYMIDFKKNKIDIY